MVTAQPSGREVFDTPLADLTTLRLGGPGKRLIEVETAEDLRSAIGDCDTAGDPVLVLGGGSNLVVADSGFPGTVVRVRSRGITVESDDDCGGVVVRVAAGEDWDAFVASAVESGWVGVEALAGIPGSVGGAPIQNVGAYGQEIADTLAKVVTFDRRRGELRTLPSAECGFGYRTSRFKRDPGRYAVVEVVLQLTRGSLGAPIRYPELARRLGVEPGDRAPAADVRAAVLELRRGKGMVLDRSDHDTWSAGSFFTNPVLSGAAAAALPEEAPRWPQAGDDGVKTSAAWLIEHTGFGKGYPGTGRIRLSTKHTLALTNRGGGTTAELVALAREIRDGVEDRFGVHLEPEPTLVGVQL